MTLKPHSQKTSIYKATALLALVFVSGAVTGAALMRLMEAQSTSPQQSAPPLNPPGLEDLSLSREQQATAHKIGEKYRPQLEAIRQEIAPRVEKIHTKMQQELLSILTPAQRRIHNRKRPSHPRGHHSAPPMGPGVSPPMGAGRSGHRPPPEAIRACLSKKSGAPCSFTPAHKHSVSGTCHRPPGDPALSCRPSFH